ncbi:flagellar hook protein [Exiguobacterium sp. 8H]|uniref:flagellar basal body rod protein FlgG n=1 Tax=Exiguobacterium TaxID=33986 RepID=UPI000938A854|nr:MULTISPECIES: flagellar basal body rod protein FlgG [Exiguobacterium]MBG0916736.1 flagellar hook-basal body complex protein [Exiguobacterium sp. SRB7LM]QPI66628.1 flagellar hook-basal body complex protein [Exiguobacterium sp. PBE]VXB08273.1 flagellar hook protein [Exiguobacterium sp. 8A]VXB08360.1 flagellar hook protein [Exiguobacterium sp. 8H]
MLRAMYSGISGLKNFQSKLDVVGNNIANVNTFGYKKGRVTFKDLVSQQVGSASAGNATTGGINPKEVGLGGTMATVDNVYNQGAMQNTGRALDVGISGEGFYATMVNGQIQYTRAGNFYTDNQGNLVTGDGTYLIGSRTSTLPASGTPGVAATPVAGDFTGPGADLAFYAADDTTAKAPEYGRIKIPTDARSLSISKDGQVSFVDGAGELQIAGYIVTSNFSNNAGLSKVGANNFVQSQNSGAPQFGVPGSDGRGELVSGALEMSNVDLSEEFTEMIVAQRGFQANTRIITTSDEILQELVNLKR